ncbi:Hypothetical protein A7982_10922 [Minicystis rosea]|nr:Hypothetical protein A7982_10922 [Minicystis rosea]
MRDEGTSRCAAPILRHRDRKAHVASCDDENASSSARSMLRMQREAV